MMWTDDSAMWQLIHGQHDTSAYRSAEDYIRVRLAGRTQAELNAGNEDEPDPINLADTANSNFTPGSDS